MKEYYRVVAEIDLDAICDNIRNTRKILKQGTMLMAIVKADGYGHGAVPISKVLEPLVDAYGVAIVEEGIELRDAGIKKPILVLGCVPAMQYHCLLEYDIIPAVTSYDMAEEMSMEGKKQGKVLNIHIKIDTGMSRIGFQANKDSIEAIKKIASLPNIHIDGCFSHFAKADEADKTFAKEQLHKFMSMVDWLEAEGIAIPIKHISNSAGIIDIKEANLDMVRSGISTYGLYPSEEVDKSQLFLKPAMKIYSYISFVKELEAFVPIGYGGTFITKKKTKVATIPVGYGDGYKRALSNQGYVIIKGVKAPIIGRVCMDQFMVDVSEIEDVKINDKAILVGQEGKEVITLEQIGAMTCSFNYEVACDIGKRIPRIYRYHNEIAGTCDYYETAKKAFHLNF